MNIDPSVNLVVFAVKKPGLPDKLLGEGPTRAKDCVQRIWKDLVAENDVTPADVTAMYSEWQPSAEDFAFLKANFPGNLDVTYSFKRPAEADWDEALREAEQDIRKSMLEKEAKDA